MLLSARQLSLAAGFNQFGGVAKIRRGDPCGRPLGHNPRRGGRAQGPPLRIKRSRNPFGSIEAPTNRTTYYSSGGRDIQSNLPSLSETVLNLNSFSCRSGTNHG